MNTEIQRLCDSITRQVQFDNMKHNQSAVTAKLEGQNCDLDNYLANKQNEYGSKFDASDLAPQFAPYYHDRSKRLVVQYGSETLSGWIGATTGWKPSFLLMRTSRSIGSPFVLSANDKILKVKTARSTVYR